MSVRQSLLAILDQGPCYGYQLRAEFDRRTGSTWPLNVGQIYTTLDRLERDGLVTKGEADAQGHVFWHITPAGSDEVRAWWTASVDRPAGTRDELAIKLAVAATLPGADALAVVRAQRPVTQARVDELCRSRDDAAATDGDLARSLIIDAMLTVAEAELHWLDRLEQQWMQHPPAETSFGLTVETPKRGRPVSARPDKAVAQ
ncbi:MAG TPA: PadR family transcriptional regulator [Quisquiliibacterium sp.]|nr:PadR family transcriptional regulator [Quisquiliibacterium sp.]